LIRLLTAMLHEHFGGHFHQLAIDTHLIRLAGDTQYADQLLVEHQRQVHPGPYTVQLLGSV
jgi:hypothetical protein